MEPPPDQGVYSTDWSGVHLTLRQAVPHRHWQEPLLQGFLFSQKGQVMPIILWLLGVPLVVVIGLYLLHVI